MTALVFRAPLRITSWLDPGIRQCGLAGSSEPSVNALLRVCPLSLYGNPRISSLARELAFASQQPRVGLWPEGVPLGPADVTVNP